MNANEMRRHTVYNSTRKKATKARLIAFNRPETLPTRTQRACHTNFRENIPQKNFSAQIQERV